MKINASTLITLIGIAAIGIVLTDARAARAAENQADWTTKLNVKLSLLNKLGTDSLHVDVEAAEGAVTLTGTVHKRETMELATTVAKAVTGVKSVKNSVRLEADVANPSKSSAAVGEAEAEVKDAILATKLRLALVDKMGTDAFKIGTVVSTGVVTLEFDRDFTSDQRQRAMTVAKGVEGVSKVVSVDKKK